MQKSRRKKSKDNSKISKILLMVLLAFLIIEVILIPFLVLAEVKRMLPIVFFIILPTISLIVILLLSRNCLLSYDKKKSMVMAKINQQ